jgi:heat shock protein HslJ
VKITSTAFLVAVPLALASCAADSAERSEYESVHWGPAALFDNTRWNLVELDGAHVPSGADIHITFDTEGRASGRSGVNSFFSQAEPGDDNALTFGPVGATKMAGPEEDMNREHAFFQALDATRRFKMSPDYLQLFDKAGAVLARFRREQSHAPGT